MRVVSMSGEIVDAGEEILNEKACGSLIGTPGESFNHKEHEGTQRKAGMDARSLVFSSRGGNLVTLGGWAQLELSFRYLREWGNGC
jgi:hypothetical protein